MIAALFVQPRGIYAGRSDVDPWDEARDARLYAVLPVGVRPPSLRWGASNPPPIGSGARRGNLESLSKLQRAATPPAFAELLIGIARLAR